MTREEAICILERRSTIPDAEASWLDIMQAFDMAIEALKAERPHGEWTTNGNDLVYICSVCGEVLPYSDEYDYKTNFCPNCGAPMTEEA